MKYFNFLLLFLLSSSISCKNDTISTTEKVQKNHNKVVDVSRKIIDINHDILFGSSTLFLLDTILIVCEIEPKGIKGIHLFNKKTFKHIVSTGFVGKGPGEILRPGPAGVDDRNKIFWIPDLGKTTYFKFPLDSVLHNPDFKPTVERKMSYSEILISFGFLNDSIAIGKAMHPTSDNSYKMVMSKLNLKTGLIENYGYEHPSTLDKKSYSSFALSNKSRIYVNCYITLDLMTICDLDGKLKYNIYGPGWFDSKQVKNTYYFDAVITSKNIITSYIGEGRYLVKGNIVKGNSPSKLIVYDLEGNYLKTIEVGFNFTRFCVDEKNKRIIVYFIDREEPLGYFDISFLDRN